MTGVGESALVAVVAPHRVAGIDEQTRAPDEAHFGPDGLRRALASPARLIWVLAAGGTPRADALERLLDALRPEGAASVVLAAGAVVDRGGALDERHLPAFRVDGADVVGSAGRGLLPIRHTTLANVLLERACLESHGLPDPARFGRFAAVEWSARVLRDADGYFVPASAVELADTGPNQLRLGSVPALVRTLRSGAWTRGDQLAAVQGILLRPGAAEVQ